MSKEDLTFLFLSFDHGFFSLQNSSHKHPCWAQVSISKTALLCFGSEEQCGKDKAWNKPPITLYAGLFEALYKYLTHLILTILRFSILIL